MTKQTLIKEKATYKTQNFYILLAFSLITTVLLTAVSIHYYLNKHLAKQKHLLSFYDKSNGLKKFYIDNVNHK